MALKECRSFRLHGRRYFGLHYSDFFEKKKRKNLVPRGTLKLHNGLLSSFSLTGKVIPPFEYFSLHRPAGCGTLLFESYIDFFETKGIRSAVSRAKECLPQT